MAVYKNKPKKQPKVNRVTNEHVTESRIELDVHTGTHIDAPLHMVRGGEAFETVEVYEDALGIERSQPGHPTHKKLFANGVIVIEGLRLREVEQGEYFMVAAPLKLVGTDASPVRVLLLESYSHR